MRWGAQSFVKKFGKERLIRACQRGLDYGIYNYKIIQNILERGLDSKPRKKLNNCKCRFTTT